MLRSRGATEAHCQVDGHPSRSLLPLPRPSSTCPPLPKRGSLHGGGGDREGASSQDGGRAADLDSESDLDMTGVGPILPVTRKAPAAEAAAGTGGVAKGNPPAPSAPSRRAEIGGVNDSSNPSSSSNTSHTSSGSSSTSGSVSNGDIPVLTRTEARRLQYFGKLLRTTERTHEVPTTGLDFE